MSGNTRKKVTDEKMENKENNLKLPSALPDGFMKTAETGLTDDEAASRISAGKSNRQSVDGSKTTLEIIRDNALTFFNILNLALGVCLILVGSYRNMLFLMIAIINTGIAIYQEIHARNEIQQMQILNAPKAHVLRNGKETVIPSDEVVEGDLVIFRNGDQIIADGVVIQGRGNAMESLLTGESNPIPKEEGAWLYSGAYVTEGKLIAQMVYVGDASYVGRLAIETRKASRPKSGLMTEMNKLIRWDSIALIPLGLLLFAKQYFLGKHPLQTSVTSSVGAMIGMIPEGLVLLTSVAMAVGVIRLVKKNVLVQELYGIESLARTDVLCLDKTGTITSGKMKVEVFRPGVVGETKAKRELSRFLGAFDEKSGTLNALRAWVEPGTETPEAVLPFSSKRKKSAARFSDGTVLILGAPDYVMGEHFAESSVRSDVEALAAEGKRVLLFARGQGKLDENTNPCSNDILALIALEDELRNGAAETLRYFREEGVDIRVISGDDPRTVSRIARMAGLDHWDRAVDARELTTAEQIAEACDKYTVFGRVSPEQKKELVLALRGKGHVVGMTGDGVNDIPAMKSADCSIAMAEGSDAAKNAAQLTLLESDFNVVPDIVLEGRRVINNITRSASLFLTKTVFSILLSVLTLLLIDKYPFEPIHMSLVSGATVGIPGFFLSLELSKERIKGHFLKNVLRRALPGGIAVTVSSLLIMGMLDKWIELAEKLFPALTGSQPEMMNTLNHLVDKRSTVAVWICGIVCVVILLRSCWKPNWQRLIIVFGALVLFVGGGLLFGNLFKLSPLDSVEQIAVLVGTVIGILVIVISDLVLRRIPFFNDAK